MGFKDTKFIKPSKDAQNSPTRHLYFAGLGHQIGTDLQQVRQYMEATFGPLDAQEGQDGIYMPEERRYLVVSFQTLAIAMKAWDFFQSEPDLTAELGASKVLVKYAHIAEAVQKPPEPECTTSTDDLSVAGLHVIPNFLSEEEERLLMNEFGDDSAPWRESLSRRVQVRLDISSSSF